MSRMRQSILAILLFGSVWGGMEAVVTASMGGGEGPMSRSVILALVAVLVLSYARFTLPHRGSIIAIGIVAAGFKFLGLPNLYSCQLAGVVGQALVLEVAYSLIEARRRETSIGARAILMGVAGYVNAIAFCASQAYLFQNHWWADRGFGGLVEWVASNGSLAALASVAGFGAACLLHRSRVFTFNRFMRLRPAVFNSAAIAIATCCWVGAAALVWQ